jgi:general secretion pathway protein G
MVEKIEKTKKEEQKFPVTEVLISKTNKAFTLIELLVVISIIGLLSTIIFAVFSTSRVQAIDTAKKETVHSVQQAVELYYTKHGTYPPNFSNDLSSNLRTTPAIQGDSASGSAYTESMQILVEDKDLPSVPETTSGAGYAYYNAGDSAVFFTSLTGGYGGVTPGQIFPSSAAFYAGDLPSELWPTTLKVTLQSVNGTSCGNLAQEMTYVAGSNPPLYQRSGSLILLVAKDTRTAVSGNVTWTLSLRNLAAGPCQGQFSLLRTTTADNPMGYFYGINSNGDPDSNLSIAAVESVN